MDFGTLGLNGDCWMAYEELPLGYDSPLYRIADGTITRVDGDERGTVETDGDRFRVTIGNEQWEAGFAEANPARLTFNIVAGPDVGYGILMRDGEWADEFRAAAQEYRLRPQRPIDEQLAGFSAALGQIAS